MGLAILAASADVSGLFGGLSGRIVAGKKLSDRVSIKDLCEKTRMSSVNQMNALEKISLTWKALRGPSSSLSDVLKTQPINDARTSRAQSRGDLRPSAKTTIGQRNVPHSLVALWNAYNATVEPTVRPDKVPKRAIRTFVNTLPV